MEVFAVGDQVEYADQAADGPGQWEVVEILNDRRYAIQPIFGTLHWQRMEVQAEQIRRGTETQF